MNTKTIEIKNKISDITNLATKLAFKMKTIEIEGKIPNDTNLATKAALNAKAKETENKIPNITSFITSPDFSRLTKLTLDGRMKKAAKKRAIKCEVKNTLDLGDKNRVKMKKLPTFDAGYFIWQKLFWWWLIKKSFDINQCFTMPAGGDKSLAWKSFSGENNKSHQITVLLQRWLLFIIEKFR